MVQNKLYLNAEREKQLLTKVIGKDVIKDE